MRSTRFLAVTLVIAVTAMTSLPASGASVSEAYPEGSSTVRHATRICAAYARAGWRHFRHLWPTGEIRILTWWAKTSELESRLFRHGYLHLKALDWPTADKATVARWLGGLKTQASLLDRKGRAIRVLRWLVREKRNDLRTVRQLKRRADSNQRWAERIDRQLKRNARLSGRAAKRLANDTLTGRRFDEACVRTTERYI